MIEDSELVLRAQKGDNLAFEQLVTKYDNHVLNIAYSYRNNKDEADDVYQEVFMRVYKGLNNFQSRSKFSTWLYRITVNVCIELKRKEKVRDHESLNKPLSKDENYSELGDILESDSNTEEMVLKNEASEIIKDEINKLPKQLKMAFTLKYYQGMKIKEISKIMNCTDGTIKGYLFTASRKLRTSLKPVLGLLNR